MGFSRNCPGENTGKEPLTKSEGPLFRVGFLG